VRVFEHSERMYWNVNFQRIFVMKGFMFYMFCSRLTVKRSCFIHKSNSQAPAFVALCVDERNTTEIKAHRCIPVTRDKCNNCFLSYTVQRSSRKSEDLNRTGRTNPGLLLRGNCCILATSKGCLCSTVLIMSFCPLHT